MKMRPYFQSTSFTCAASSLLTILHYIKNEIPLTKDKEFDIWKKTTNLPTRGSSIYALAIYAKEQGLNPKVIVENKAYSFPDYRFYRYTKEDIEHAAFSEQQHLNDFKKKKVELEEREITLEDIKKEIRNNPILLRLNTKPIRKEKKNTSNYVVVQSFIDNYYQIFDPLLGGLSIPIRTMQEAFDSLETKKYRDHRMIVFT